MNFIIGTLTAIVCTLGTYALEGGRMEVLAEAAPAELVIILGTIIGAFVIANPNTVILRTLSSMKKLFKKQKYGKNDYIELLSMMYQVFKLAKTKGMLTLEHHIDNPHDSSLFSPFPTFLSDHHVVDFFTDYLRLVTLGSDKPYEIEALMDEEIEVHHSEMAAVVTSVSTMADGLPAIGIVAAVLGIIKAMGAITEPPEILGRMVGGALVGTFMGVWLSYGYVGPVASSLNQILGAESRYFQCMKVGLLAHLQGCAPSVSVEYARKTLLTNVRPSFTEVEEATQSLPAPG
ncbi:MAG: flagellar motor stator protein MotA [Alphaproteobacteria bacterium]|nr:flagellar motor stator protein MotA [Alphaproteobacteria bacterium]